MADDQIYREIRDFHKDVMNSKDYQSPEYFARREFMDNQMKYLKEFLLTKRVEGCKKNTIRDYHDKLMRFILWTDVDLVDITRKDIKRYLTYYQDTHTVQESTIDQIRLVLSTFFEFLEDEEYILRNPVKGIHKIRSEEKIRLPFSDEEIVLIKQATHNIRDLAIIDLLYTSGMRIGELIELNIKDVNFNEREVIVNGKGGTQRICYFNADTKIELLKYLNTRTDREPALFVRLRYPHKRLNKGGVRNMLKIIERETGVEDIHPHRFRRTLATNLLNKGMTLEQVQAILGHKKIETTLIYAKVNQNMTKINHQKYMG